MQTVRFLMSWMFGQPHWLTSDWSLDEDSESDEPADDLVPMEWLSPRYMQPKVNLCHHQVDHDLEY